MFPFSLSKFLFYHVTDFDRKKADFHFSQDKFFLGHCFKLKILSTTQPETLILSWKRHSCRIQRWLISRKCVPLTVRSLYEQMCFYRVGIFRRTDVSIFIAIVLSCYYSQITCIYRRSCWCRILAAPPFFISLDISSNCSEGGWGFRPSVLHRAERRSEFICVV